MFKILKKRWAFCMAALMATAGTAQAATPVSMTIATGVDPSFSAFYIGHTQGIFEKNGLRVQLRTGPSGSAMVAFVIQNQVQAAFGAEQAGVQNFNIDQDVVLVAEGTSMSEFYGIVGRNAEDLEALKGKRIGVARGSASEVFWLAVAKAKNLNLDDYEIVQVEPPEMIAALERGNIDAFASWEPWLTRAIDSISDTAIVQDQVGIMDPRVFVYMNKSWIDKNPEAAQAFVESLVEATAFINDNTEQAADDVSKFLKLDRELTEMLMRKFSYDMRLTQESISNFVTVSEQLEESKKLAKPVDWNAFVYPDLLKAVSPDKVDYELPQ